MRPFLRDNVDRPKGTRRSTGGKVGFVLTLGKLVVGYLHFDQDEWTFRYSEEFIAQDTVKPIVDFPNPERAYTSSDLWPFFALRIPSTTQAQVKAYLRDTGNEMPDEASMLKQFGQRCIANPFELVVG